MSATPTTVQNRSRALRTMARVAPMAVVKPSALASMPVPASSTPKPKRHELKDNVNDPIDRLENESRKQRRRDDFADERKRT